MTNSTRTLLRFIEEAYHRKSWHGTNLRGSLRGISPQEATARPRADRHNISEIVIHTAYWKYAVWRKITGAKRGSFPLKGSDWFPRSEPLSDAELRQDIALLDEQHAKLCETVGGLSEGDLDRKFGEFTLAGLLSGVAAHDLYHAGQIQLLKKLVRSSE